MVKWMYKMRDRKTAMNYRPATLMITVFKLYAEVLRERMSKKLKREEKLGKTQMGFREGRGTIDAICLLKTVIGENLNWMAIESGTAFDDNVDRKEIVRMMEEVGLGKDLRRAVEEIYGETKSIIVIGEREVVELRTDKGMRQGCPLSPMLFQIVFADLEKRMRRCQEAELTLGRENI